MSNNASNDLADGIGKLIEWGFLIYFAAILVFWLVVAAVILVAVLAVAAVILAGVVALYAAKSAKALVTERRVWPALWYSAVAAAGLTGAIMLSSATILFASPAATEVLGVSLTTPIAGTAQEIIGWLLALVNDSIAFFVRLVPVCFLANRIFIARQQRGYAWLGIVPPLFAMLVFSIAAHYDELVQLAQNPTWELVLAMAGRTGENLMQPLRLAVLGFQDPNALLLYLQQQFVAAWPNLFKLAKFYPTAFLLYGLAVTGRTLAG